MAKQVSQTTLNSSMAMDKETLAVQWFEFLHDVHENLIDIYREAKIRGIDQKEIGKRLDMNAGQVSRYLRGRQNMTIRTIHNLARAMGCRPVLTFVRLDSLPVANRRYSNEWQEKIERSTSGSADAEYFQQDSINV